MSTSLLRRAGAECVGSYALVTAGCGAIMVNATTGALGHSGVAFTFGLVIIIMVAATEHLSGAHFNLAVTVAFALARHFPWRDVPLYAGGQLAGAIGGALTLRALLRPRARGGRVARSLGLLGRAAHRREPRRPALPVAAASAAGTRRYAGGRPPRRRERASAA